MIAPPREVELLRIPPGDRTARLEHYARVYRDGLGRSDITERHRERLRQTLRELRELARKLGCRVAMLEAEDTKAEAPSTAVFATRAFEVVAVEMHEERGLAKEDVALALISTGLSQLSATWPQERAIAQLISIIGRLIDTHHIDQTTGEAMRPDRNGSALQPLYALADRLNSRLGDARL